MNWQELEQCLAKNNHDQLFLLHGEDEWQIHKASQMLIGLLPEYLRGVNVERFNGKNLQPRELDIFQQGSLFGDQRLIFLEEPPFFKATRSETAKTNTKRNAAEDEDQQWQNALDELRQSLIVVIICNSSVDKRRKMFKWFEKNSQIVECQPMKKAAMGSFVRNQLKASGLDTEYGVVELIQEIAGDQPGVAEQEILKLVTYFAKEKRINLKDASKVLATSVEAEVFTMIDLLGERKLAQCFDLLDELLRRGEPAPRILAAFASQLKLMLQLKLLAEQGTRGDTAARQMGIHPYQAQKLGERSSLLSVKALQQLVVECSEKDSRMKSGRLGMQASLQVVFTKFIYLMQIK